MKQKPRPYLFDRAPCPLGHAKDGLYRVGYCPTCSHRAGIVAQRGPHRTTAEERAAAAARKRKQRLAEKA